MGSNGREPWVAEVSGRIGPMRGRVTFEDDDNCNAEDARTESRKSRRGTAAGGGMSVLVLGCESTTLARRFEVTAIFWVS